MKQLQQPQCSRMEKIMCILNNQKLFDTQPILVIRNHTSILAQLNISRISVYHPRIALFSHFIARCQPQSTKTKVKYYHITTTATTILCVLHRDGEELPAHFIS